MVDQRYDPDNPPEEAPRELVGLVITSAYVTSEAEANAIDPTLGERYRKFNESFVTDTGIQNPECWVQRIQASKLVYEDTGELLVFSQLVRTVNKKGQPLPQGQAPSLLATQYREATGKRASPLAVERPCLCKRLPEALTLRMWRLTLPLVLALAPQKKRLYVS
jgi:hypothetical protein